MSNIKTIFGRNLRDVRRLRNLSQKELADKVGLSQSQYSKIERGDSEINLSKIEKLCAVLNIDAYRMIKDHLLSKTLKDWD